MILISIFRFALGEGYGGDFRYLSWNEKLGLRKWVRGKVEGLVEGWLKEMSSNKVNSS